MSVTANVELALLTFKVPFAVALAKMSSPEYSTITSYSSAPTIPSENVAFKSRFSNV